MEYTNIDILRADYEQAARNLNAAEPFKMRYPNDWRGIQANFQRAKRAYEKAIAEANRANVAVSMRRDMLRDRE